MSLSSRSPGQPGPVVPIPSEKDSSKDKYNMVQFGCLIVVKPGMFEAESVLQNCHRHIGLDGACTERK